jgi:hypothetical protein
VSKLLQVEGHAPAPTGSIETFLQNKSITMIEVDSKKTVHNCPYILVCYRIFYIVRFDTGQLVVNPGTDLYDKLGTVPHRFFERLFS